MLELFCKGRFSQLYINYHGLYQWNTIDLGQNIDFEQFTTLKFLKQKFKTYFVSLDHVTLLF